MARSRYSEQVRGWTLLGSNPGRDENLFSLAKHTDRFWGPGSLLLNQYRA